MSPVLRFCLTLAGTLLFGWPLAAILRSTPGNLSDRGSSTAATAGSTTPAVLTVRFTGEPARLAVYQGAACIAVVPENETSPWETDVKLPEGEATLELRAEGTWPAASGAQAVTLELEPLRKRSRQATRWAQHERMNDIFTFSWR